MDREETKRILAVIAVTYPNFHPADRAAMLGAWAAVLDPYPYEQINTALIAYIRTDRSGFAPAPGQLIGMIEEAGSGLSEGEAWAMVYRAFVNTSVYDMTKAFSLMPEDVQKAVGSPGQLYEWGYCSSMESLPVIEATFKKAYRTEAKRQQVREAVKTNLSALVQRTTNAMIGG